MTSSERHTLVLLLVKLLSVLALTGSVAAALVLHAGPEPEVITSANGAFP